MTAATRTPKISYALQMCGVFAAYLVLGRIGLLLAIPPGFASAIFPASGIALAAVLVFGVRIWPALFAGSFALNMWMSWDSILQGQVATSVFVAAGIATGATLQACLGKSLIHRAVPVPGRLSHEKDVAKFLIFGGPISCLVNALIGPMSLFANGVVESSALLRTIGTWWVGDTLGVLVFAPVALAFIGSPAKQWRKRRVTVALPLLIAFALVTVFFVSLSNAQLNSIHSEFHEKTIDIADELTQYFMLHEETLLVPERFIALTSNVRAEDFKEVIGPILTIHPAFQAFGWAPRVDAKLVSAFEKERLSLESRTENFGEEKFFIHEKNSNNQKIAAAGRSEYFPFLFIESRDAGHAGIGFDIASDPMRAPALQRARKSGQSQMALLNSLLRDAKAGENVSKEKSRPAFFLIKPVYNRNVLEDETTRKKNLRGFIASVVRADEMLAAVLKSTLSARGIEVSLFHENEFGTHKRLLVTSRLHADVKALKNSDFRAHLKSSVVASVLGQ